MGYKVSKYQILSIWLTAFCILAVFSFSKILSYDSAEKYISIVVILFSILHLSLDYRHSRHKYLLNPYNIFYISLFLFNAGFAILTLFPSSGGLANIKESPDLVFKAFLFVSLSMIFFALGSILVGKGVSNRVDLMKSDYNLSITKNEDKLARFTIMGLLVLSAPFYITNTIQKASLVLRYGYFGSYGKAIDSGNEISSFLSDFFVIALLASMVLFRKQGFLMRVIVTLISSIIVLNITLGFRSDGFLILLASLFVYDRFVKRVLYFIWIPIIASITVFIFPLVRLYRDNINQGVLTTTNVEYNPFFAILNEIGSTITTVVETMKLIDLDQSFRWGETYYRSLTMILPSQILNSGTSDIVLSPAIWLVKNIDPAFANSGGGYGFSAIAEAYLNFGFLGGLLVMSVLGASIKLINRYIINNDDTLSLLFASYTVILIFYARQESLLLFRPLFWYVIALSYSLRFSAISYVNQRKNSRINQ